MQIYLIIAIIIAALGGGTSIAAENAVPGDILYPVKIDINEPIRGGFVFSTKGNAEWSMHKMERRLEESEKIAADAHADPALKARAKESFKAQARETLTAIAAVQAKNGADAAAPLHAALTTYLETHEEVFTQIGDIDLAKEETKENLNIAENKIAEVKQLLEKLNGSANPQAITNAKTLLNLADTLLVQLNINLATGTDNELLRKQALDAAQKAQRILNGM